MLFSVVYPYYDNLTTGDNFKPPLLQGFSFGVAVTHFFVGVWFQSQSPNIEGLQFSRGQGSRLGTT